MVTTVIYILIMLALVVAVSKWPPVALAVVMMSFGIEQWLQSGAKFFVAHPQLHNYAVGVIVLWAIFLLIIRNRPILEDYPLTGTMTIMLFAWAGLTVAWTPKASVMRQEWQQAAPYLITFCLLAPLLVTRVTDVRAMLRGILGIAAVVLPLLAIASVEKRGIVFAEVQFEQVRATVGNPLAVASMAGFAAVTAVLINPQKHRAFWTVGRWAIVAIALIVIIRSGSRGQFLAAMMASLAMLPFSRRVKDPSRWFVIAFALLLLVGLAAFIFDQIAEGQRWERQTMVNDYGWRIDVSAALVRTWLEAGPIFWLIGLGNSASYVIEDVGFYVHVVPVEVLAELGLIGFGLFAMLGFFILRALKRSYQLVADYPEPRGWVCAVGGLIIFEGLLMLKQGQLVGIPFFFCMAIVAGRMELALRRELVPWLASLGVEHDAPDPRRLRIGPEPA